MSILQVISGLETQMVGYCIMVFGFSCIILVSCGQLPLPLSFFRSYRQSQMPARLQEHPARSSGFIATLCGQAIC